MSDAQGITTGNFAAEVSSSATGGAGGRIIGNGFPISFTGGNGGDAFAAATGGNNGLNAVNVTSIAFGGAAGDSVGINGIDGIAGDATAISTASGLGSVIATATATCNFLVLINSTRLTERLAAPRWRTQAQQARAETPQRRQIPVEAFSLPSRLPRRRRSAVPANVESRARVGGAAPTLAMAAGLKRLRL